MKKYSFLILFLIAIIEQSAMAQRIEKEAKDFFKNEYGVDVNNFDEYGEKHGLWYNFNYYTSGTSDSWRYVFRVISKGNYSNGIKTGKWVHFNKFDNHYSDYSRIDYYYEDNSRLVITHLSSVYTFYSCDSLLITSMIFSDSKKDTLTIECVDKSTCYLYNNECELIFQFIYSEFNLDFVQIETGMGFYRRINQYKWLNE